jgi:hypothetical protein
MEVSGERHAPGKGHRCPLNRRLGGLKMQLSQFCMLQRNELLDKTQFKSKIQLGPFHKTGALKNEIFLA